MSGADADGGRDAGDGAGGSVGDRPRTGLGAGTSTGSGAGTGTSAGAGSGAGTGTSAGAGAGSGADTSFGSGSGSDGVDLIAVVGATGTGKSDLGIAIAERLRAAGRDAEIVNADAMQLYRGMDIGTAKLTPEERRGIPHHQLDVLEVTDEASVAAYQQAARADVERIQQDGGVAVLVGGSGLYVSSVLFDLAFPGTDPELRATLERQHAELGPGILLDRLRSLDPAAAATIDARNPRRLIRALEIASRSEVVTPSLPSAPRPWRPARILHLHRERAQLVEALHARAERMFTAGLVDEVRDLQRAGLEQGRTARAAIGYAQAIDVVHGRASVADAVDATGIATRKYARRQVSWFRRYANAEVLDVTGADRAGLTAVARRIVP